MSWRKMLFMVAQKIPSMDSLDERIRRSVELVRDAWIDADDAPDELMQWVVEGAKANVEALSVHDTIGFSGDR